MKKLKGIKYDQDKLRYSLLPGHSLKETVKVLMAGAIKYDDHNWKNVDNMRERYYNAAMRHIGDWWWERKTYDDETNLHVLAHAICCLMFIIQAEEDKIIERGNNENIN